MAEHLSPEELQVLKHLPNQLPTRGGPKEFAPDGTDEQTWRIDTMMQEYENVLCEERVIRNGALSVGFWNEKKNIAEVTSFQGTHWNTFGKVINGVMTIQPEEALFLLEIGVFELNVRGLPVSFQEAYEFLISESLPLEHYIVYAYLARLGFIVQRHKKEICDNNPEKLSSNTLKFNPNSQRIYEKPLMKSGPVSHLWDGEVTPLVRPTDARSTASILSKLQVIKTQRMKDCCVKSRFSDVSITFDVYQPGNHYKKSNPGPPDFHIVVCRHCDGAPTPADIARLTNDSCKIPMKIALVENGSVSFYAFLDVDIPTFITYG